MSNHLVNTATAEADRRQLFVEWGLILLIVLNAAIVIAVAGYIRTHYTLRDWELAFLCLALMTPGVLLKQLWLKPLQHQRFQRSFQPTMSIDLQEESP